MYKMLLTTKAASYRVNGILFSRQILKNESLEHMDDGKDIKIDSLSKFNWAIINNVVDMLNGT